jgi:hypothetical protein
VKTLVQIAALAVKEGERLKKRKLELQQQNQKPEAIAARTGAKERAGASSMIMGSIGEPPASPKPRTKSCAVSSGSVKRAGKVAFSEVELASFGGDKATTVDTINPYYIMWGFSQKLQTAGVSWNLLLVYVTCIVIIACSSPHYTLRGEIAGACFDALGSGDLSLRGAAGRYKAGRNGNCVIIFEDELRFVLSVRQSNGLVNMYRSLVSEYRVRRVRASWERRSREAVHGCGCVRGAVVVIQGDNLVDYKGCF